MFLFQGRMTISEVARKLGITTKTIIRWEKAGKIRKAKRDWNGWRYYLGWDVDQIIEYMAKEKGE